MIISIPAPARGRTLKFDVVLPVLANFNSRPREGANNALRRDEKVGVYFNSRPREGANEGGERMIDLISLFQFPPPRGGEPGILRA